MLDVYNNARLHMGLLTLVFIGSLNYLLVPFKFNLLESMLNTSVYKVLSILIVIAALVLMMDKKTWLPFLGETVLPGSLIPLKQGVGNTIVDVTVAPNTRVAYWASIDNGMKDAALPKVKDAYADYSNSGVVMSDSNGNAKLRLDAGTAYIVPRNAVIKRHVHYRELDKEYGMVGPVRTAYY